MSSSAQTPACSQTCPMVHPEVAAEFFQTIGHIRGRVDDIYDRQEKHEVRISAVERAQSCDEGRKNERRDRRTTLFSLAGALVALVLGIANYFKH